MRHFLHRRPEDKANALGWRVLWMMFAILALCATPLGPSELLAAESHVCERKKGEVRQGDQPPRFTLASDAPAATESLRSGDQAVDSSPLADDTPGTPARCRELATEETGAIRIHARSDVAAAGIDRRFRARAPPRA